MCHGDVLSSSLPWEPGDKFSRALRREARSSSTAVNFIPTSMLRELFPINYLQLISCADALILERAHRLVNWHNSFCTVYKPGIPSTRAMSYRSRRAVGT